MLYAIVAVLVIILDQWLKYWVAGNIALDVGVRELIPGVVSLVNLHNSGAAFGFLSGSGGARIYFIIICGVFTVAIIIALATNFISDKLGRWSAVFIMAGGISNCIDRVISGYVQDMFKLDFMNFAIFNLADIFITVFCIVFIIDLLFGGRRKKDEDLLYDDEEEEQEDEYDYDDDDDDDYERRPVFSRREKASRPAVSKPKPEKDSRKSRQARYDAEYEQYKAAKAARQQKNYSSPDVRPQERAAAPHVDPSNPFAEWERAGSRPEQQVREQRNSQPRMSDYQRTARTSAPLYENNPESRNPFADETAGDFRPDPYAASARRPEAPAKPQSKAQSSESEEFNLDDILNEFK